MRRMWTKEPSHRCVDYQVTGGHYTLVSTEEHDDGETITAYDVIDVEVGAEVITIDRVTNRFTWLQRYKVMLYGLEPIK